MTRLSKPPLSDAEHQRRYRAKKKRRGLCYEGGCNEPIFLYGRCELHRAAHRGAQRDRTLGKGATAHLDKQLQIQNHRCAICEEPLTAPQQDHNHKTGQLRGALCNLCNWALGRLELNGWLRKADLYLDFWHDKD